MRCYIFHAFNFSAFGFSRPVKSNNLRPFNFRASTKIRAPLNFAYLNISLKFEEMFQFYSYSNLISLTFNMQHLVSILVLNSLIVFHMIPITFGQPFNFCASLLRELAFFSGQVRENQTARKLNRKRIIKLVNTGPRWKVMNCIQYII